MRFICLLLASVSTLFFSGCGKEDAALPAEKVVYLPIIEEDFYPEIEKKKEIIKKEVVQEKKNVEKEETKKIAAEVLETTEEAKEKTTEEIVAELENIWRGEKMTPEEIEAEQQKDGTGFVLSSTETSETIVPKKEETNSRTQERKLIEIVQTVRQKETLEEQKFFLEKELGTLENKRENLGILSGLKDFMPQALHGEINEKILQIVQGGN